MTIWPDKRIVGENGVSVNHLDATPPQDENVCDHCAGEGILHPELQDGSEPSYPCPHCQHEE